MYSYFKTQILQRRSIELISIPGSGSPRYGLLRKRMLNAARRRAKKGGYPCTITIRDIPIPDFCPILGIPIVPAQERGTKGNLDFSPSLDKVRPSLGYVPGNVIVVSNRANRIKSDATVDELIRLAHFYGGKK